MAAYEAIHKAVLKTLPDCKELKDNHLDEACFVAPASNEAMGVIVYSENFRSCMEADILLPGFNLLPRALLVVVYLLMLVWVFIGVNEISDKFVSGIEVITSTRKKVKVKHPVTGEEVEIEKPVWNWVVANITLMAIGSSAPEICLATLEAILTLGHTAGELGPSCIVGSAAYNFFCITAVCTVSLAYNTTKSIKEVRVYVCTAVWSIWAHLYMYLCYSVISPGVIELWEAFVMIGQAPILVYMAFIIDTQPWKKQHGLLAGQVHPASGDVKEADPDAFEASQADHMRRRSILHYRMIAMRRNAGETNLGAEKSFKTSGPSFAGMAMPSQAVPKGGVRVGFSSTHYSVLESQGMARVVVQRTGGELTGKCTIKYRTMDGTAVAGIDYDPIEGFLTFQPGEKERVLEIKIVDDDMAEPDVTLTVMLAELSGDNHYLTQTSASVTIVDDDDGGVLAFELPTYEVGCADDHATVTVVRRHGVSGDVSVEWTTKDGSAVSGQHYQRTFGCLEIPKGEAKATVHVPILMADTKDTDHNPVFKLVLSNPLGGAVLGQRTECRVIITPGSKVANQVSVIPAGKEVAGGHKGGAGEEEEEAPFELWKAWADQFREVTTPDLEDDDWFGRFLHWCSITWKIVIAFVPPAEWKGGYPCFGVVLPILVGIVFIMKETAQLFGCAVGLSDLMTGMSLVAIGTSLPDTFASRWAAVTEETADAAIGTVTGSNSVNVFLGLGLPWVIGSVYYAAHGEKYHVEQGALGFSLVLWCAMVCGAQVLLIYSRVTQGGELGGTKQWQWTMFGILIGFYVLFLTLVGLLDSHHFSSNL